MVVPLDDVHLQQPVWIISLLLEVVTQPGSRAALRTSVLGSASQRADSIPSDALNFRAMPRTVSEVPSQSSRKTSGYSFPIMSTNAGSSFSPHTCAVCRPNHGDDDGDRAGA